MKGTLYVVATPIGNLGDMSLRAIATLKNVDLIAAEDTRVTRRLLTHFSIQTKMQRLHERNERAQSESLCALLQQGKSIALVSDAGTPVISDPGAWLVRKAHDLGIQVSPIPGANAAIAALSAAGAAFSPFLFYGFLPPKSAARQKVLRELLDLPYTLIFYEAPHRIIETVADLTRVLGAQRRFTIARELSKIHETIYPCKLGDAEEWLRQDENRLKGEFALIVEAAEQAPMGVTEDIQAVLKQMLEFMPLSQAVSFISQLVGVKKNTLYELALSLKNKDAS